MISRLHESFRRDFVRLPEEVQRRARRAYQRFKANPARPGLQFKPLLTTLPVWSIRVNNSYRAGGVKRSADEIIWFFIGTHAEYDRLLATLD